ncbi:uncharacterized protein LOC106153451 [Lingula anatina]|uniref:Uncharacterized protein LOC106153451 n=1 Tax=Lingula anatina TaxID=7574 RepID=A0A1S3HCH0_LINAN|nr:uncharacterized protein LOC106153451 [Lingula anatina]|eukprot:XP_013382844.1 uncharacterized protein LOC106153451 [Lingula anatina]
MAIFRSLPQPLTHAPRCTGTETALSGCPVTAVTCTNNPADVVFLACSDYKRRCHYNEFTCDNERCIPLQDVCDFTDHCGDKSDERNCSSYAGRCDFETDFCNWLNLANEKLNWTRVRGDLSAQQGPRGDHGGDRYSYYLTLQGNAKETGSIALSQRIIPSSCTLSFYWFKTAVSDRITIRVKRTDALTYPVPYGHTVKRGEWAFVRVNIFPAHYDWATPSTVVIIDGALGTASRGIYLDDITLSPECRLALPPPTCSARDFRCGSGECISEDKICNYDKDCIDDSDEANCAGWLRCDFQTDFCGWSNAVSQDNFDWTRHSWATSTVYTGPSYDHTLMNNQGKYIYTEASVPRQSGNRAVLRSQIFTVSGLCKMRFFYHMYGNNMGNLSVSVQNRDRLTQVVQKWSMAGNQGDRWHFAAVDLRTTGIARFRVLLVGTVTGFPRSDIAVDDVSFTPGCTLAAGTEVRPKGYIRLRGGPVSNAGRIEIYHDGSWGTVCDDGFDQADAEVVCRELGYIGAVFPKLNSFYGPGRGNVWLSELQCSGQELFIRACTHSGWNARTCDYTTHSEDAGVVCDTAGSVGMVRLSHGETFTRGRLEVHYGGKWGVVCAGSRDINIVTNVALVVCRQLGHRNGVVLAGRSVPSDGAVLSGLLCVGNERAITECRHDPYGSPSVTCFDSSALWLSCDKDTLPLVGSLRLVGGNTLNAGRLEIYLNGLWNSMCSNIWTAYRAANAQVACTQLGFAFASEELTTEFGQGTAVVHFQELRCAGLENSILDCSPPTSHSQFSWCPHVGIVCEGRHFPNSTRLNDGQIADSFEGVLEVFERGQWHTACTERFNENMAAVVCKERGYAKFLAFHSFPVAPSADVYITKADCTGNETRLSQCPHHGWIRMVDQCMQFRGFICYRQPLSPEKDTSALGVSGGCGSDGGTSSGNGSMGWLQTPLFRRKYYDNNVLCKWAIVVPVGYTINLQFDVDSVTESCCDSVKLFKELEGSVTLLRNLAGRLPNSKLHVNANIILVEFSSDASMGAMGFRLWYRAVPPYTTTSTTTTTPRQRAPAGTVGYRADTVVVAVVVPVVVLAAAGSIAYGLFCFCKMKRERNSRDRFSSLRNLRNNEVRPPAACSSASQLAPPPVTSQAPPPYSSLSFKAAEDHVYTDLDNGYVILQGQDHSASFHRDGNPKRESDTIENFCTQTPPAATNFPQRNDRVCNVAFSGDNNERSGVSDLPDIHIRQHGGTPGHDIPKQFLCPIKGDLMKDPVIASDGITYDRAAITHWLSGSRISPVTANAMADTNLTPNNQLRESIATWRLGNPEIQGSYISLNSRPCTPMADVEA